MKKTIDLKKQFKTVRTNLKKIYFFLQNERLFLQTFEKTNCFLMNERFFSKNLKKTNRFFNERMPFGAIVHWENEQWTNEIKKIKRATSLSVKSNPNVCLTPHVLLTLTCVDTHKFLPLPGLMIIHISSLRVQVFLNAGIRDTSRRSRGILRDCNFKLARPDSQRYTWNLYLININVEDCIVVF